MTNALIRQQLTGRGPFIVRTTDGKEYLSKLTNRFSFPLEYQQIVF